MDEEYTPSQKKKILFSCLIALFIGNLMIMNVTAFLPLYAEKRTDWDNNETVKVVKNSTGSDVIVKDSPITSPQISLIISIFSIAQIIFAPFNSAIKNKMGSKNTIIFGFILMTATTFGIGTLTHMSNHYKFVYTAVLLRFF